MLVHNAKAAKDLLHGLEGTARLNTTHTVIFHAKLGMVWFGYMVLFGLAILKPKLCMVCLHHSHCHHIIVNQA